MSYSYKLEIGEDLNDLKEFKALDVEFLHASNGEIGGVDFTLDNDRGEKFRQINYRDWLMLEITDWYGKTDEFKLLVKNIDPEGKWLHIEAQTGLGILADRKLWETFPAVGQEQDIGQTVKDIIDGYCQPLTSNNVNTNTGIEREIVGNDKTALSVLEEIRREYQVYYFVDKDWDFHFYLEEETERNSFDYYLSYGE